MAVCQLNPYIHFNGNAAEAIRHYERLSCQSLSDPQPLLPYHVGTT